MRCAAKMVLINVDFPRPVCPTYKSAVSHCFSEEGGKFTDTDNVELKASFQQLPLDLACDGIETDIAPQRSDFSLQRRVNTRKKLRRGKSGAKGEIKPSGLFCSGGGRGSSH